MHDRFKHVPGQKWKRCEYHLFSVGVDELIKVWPIVLIALARCVEPSACPPW